MINLLFVNLVLIAIAFGVIWFLTRNTTIVRIKRGQVIDFHGAMDLAGFPIITLYQGRDKYNFLIDSGSSHSYINGSVPIIHGEIIGKAQYFGHSGKVEETKVTEIQLYYKETKYKNLFRIADLDSSFNTVKSNFGVTLHGIIGCDFMNAYKYCIDFKESVIYIRK